MWGKIRTLLYGFSQVMLQKNWLTGLLFLLGIAINSIPLATGALAGLFIGNLTALLMKYPKKEFDEGLYGYNAVLVGIAVFLFYGITPISIIFLIIGAALSTIILHIHPKKSLPAYTAPFVLATWCIEAIGIVFGTKLAAGSGMPAQADILSAISNGFGQVMFQQNPATGALFFIGVLISSVLAGIFSVLASAIGVIVPILINFNLDRTYAGIFSYNAVLCGIAFAGYKLENIIKAATAAVLSIILVAMMIQFGIPALTAPFVLACWIVLLLRKLVK